MDTDRYIASCPVCPDGQGDFEPRSSERQAEVDADIHNGLVHYDEQYATVTTIPQTAAD